MTKQELLTRREQLEKWLADNISSGNWDQVKDEYNEICYKISELDNEVSPFRKQRAPQEFVTPKSIYNGRI